MARIITLWKLKQQLDEAKRRLGDVFPKTTFTLIVGGTRLQITELSIDRSGTLHYRVLPLMEPSSTYFMNIEDLIEIKSDQ